ncbi:MAG: aromatic amino acid transport family protein [Patescibacteria group bacterium]|nr:aromatic amino acid transport family protein [Patescibacteria group bacterium]
MLSESKKGLETVALLIGTIVGAGILGIPFVVAQVGIGIGVAYIIGAGLLFLVLNLMMGEVVARTRQPRQLAGLSKKYLGAWGGRLSVMALYLGAYSAMLAYIIGEGEVLAAILGGTPFFWSIVFFIAGAALLARQIKSIAIFELLFTIAIFVVVIIIAAASSAQLSLDNLITVNWPSFFLPFGVMLFAFGGTGAIPQMEELIPDNPRRLRWAIAVGSLVPIALYLIFAVIVVGVTGSATTEVATVGLGQRLGSWALILGNIFAFFTMSTSFVMSGVILRRSFEWDWNISSKLSWPLVVAPPILVFLAGVNSFIGVLNITGAIVGGILAILIVLAFWRAKKMGDIKSRIFNLRRSLLIGIFLILVFAIGSVYAVIDMLR